MVAFRDDGRFLTPPAHDSVFECVAPMTSDRSFVWRTGGQRLVLPPDFGRRLQTGRKMRKERAFETRSDVIRHSPQSVLVVLADAERDVAGLLSALRPHFALVCSSPAQGVEAAPAFEPDVVLIDDRIADQPTLVRDLNRVTGGRKMALVALGSRAGGAVPDFAYHLPNAASAGELEQLLWRIRRDTGPTPTLGGPTGRERVG
jgi:hypothetical protein